MKITALFTESNPAEWKQYIPVSGKRVEIIDYRPVGDGYSFKYEDFTGFAFAHELTEPSHPLSLLAAKQRILGE